MNKYFLTCILLITVNAFAKGYSVSESFQIVSTTISKYPATGDKESLANIGLELAGKKIELADIEKDCSELNKIKIDENTSHKDLANKQTCNKLLNAI